MRKTILIILFVFGFGRVFCQTIQPEVIATSGDYFKPSASMPSLSWTAGECITETFAAGSAILTQGCQQSLYVVAAIDEIQEPELSISVFPNPTSDYISIAVRSSGGKEKDFKIELYDLQGKLLFTAAFHTSDFGIGMSAYPAGMYLLRALTAENKVLQNFKIQKSN